MGIDLIFKGKVSSHGKGKYMIYIPKQFSEKAKELHGNGEIIVIIAREG